MSGALFKRKLFYGTGIACFMCIADVENLFFFFFVVLNVIHTSSLDAFFRNAQPMAKLKDAYRKFLARSMTRPKVTNVCIY